MPNQDVLRRVRIALFDDEIETKVPCKATNGSAAFDLFSAYELGPLSTGTMTRVRTNLVMEIPRGWVGKIYSRSGHGAKHKIRLANGTGIIDSDYRGEIVVCLQRDEFGRYEEPEIVDIKKNTCIAQILFEPVYPHTFMVVDRDWLSDTVRGSGGFGSTGNTGEL